MKYIILTLIMLLASCVPNDNNSTYTKVEVAFVGIIDPIKRILLLDINGFNTIKFVYNRDVLQISWLKIVRTQHDHPRFTLLMDENNKLYRL